MRLLRRWRSYCHRRRRTLRDNIYMWMAGMCIWIGRYPSDGDDLRKQCCGFVNDVGAAYRTAICVAVRNDHELVLFVGAGRQSQRHSHSASQKGISSHGFTVVADSVGVFWRVFFVGAASGVAAGADWIQERNSCGPADVRVWRVFVYSGSVGARVWIFLVRAVRDGLRARRAGSRGEPLRHNPWSAGVVGTAPKFCPVVQRSWRAGDADYRQGIYFVGHRILGGAACRNDDRATRRIFGAGSESREGAVSRDYRDFLDCGGVDLFRKAAGG